LSPRIFNTRLRLLGSGSALPGEALSSAELLARIAAHFELPTRTGEVLARRLGVKSRHHSRDWQSRYEPPRAGDRNPELAARAVCAALAQAAVTPAGLQYLLGHTTTPARLLPPNIAEVATLLGVTAPYAELRQACTGFANALQWAGGLLAAPDALPVAIVGSETGSAFFDPQALHEDPGQWVNLMQMGDGAGAVVLGPYTERSGSWLESLFFGHIGLGRAPGFTLDEGGSDFPALREGRACATFQHDFDAVKREGGDLFRAALAAARTAGVELDALTAIIPHQANGKIGDWLANATGLPHQRFFGNGAQVGNLGSASIWVALHDLRMSGQLDPGDRVLVLGAEATQYLYGGFVYVHG
jgi:3-oxoacyl-[acyl-carrier-protein] synthase-3